MDLPDWETFIDIKDEGPVPTFKYRILSIITYSSGGALKRSTGNIFKALKKTLKKIFLPELG